MTDQWTDRLSAYLDGELEGPAVDAIEAHLAECPTCRTLLDELKRVVARAQALDDRPPATDLWPGIAERIGASTGVVDPAPRRDARRRRIWVSIPQLAAAAVALAAFSGGLVWLVMERGQPGPVASIPPAAPSVGAVPVASFAETTFDAAVRDLERALANGRGRLDTATVRVLEQSLQTIDAAIAEARSALAADPASPYLNRHLAETMRRKLELLRRAATLASAET